MKGEEYKVNGEEQKVNEGEGWGGVGGWEVGEREVVEG